MHPDLKKVFDHFDKDEVAIFGSSVRDYGKAGDIDVMFPADAKYHDVIKRVGASYKGGFDTPRGRVRRSTYRIPGVNKDIHLVQNAGTKTFKDHPHAVMLRSGEVLNPGVHFDKDAATKRKAARSVDPKLAAALKKMER